jgi:hypothetical protein
MAHGRHTVRVCTARKDSNANGTHIKTDAQLLADAEAELNRDPANKADEVSVCVTDGVVTTRGHTATFA